MESIIQTVLDSFTWIDTRLDREKGGWGGGGGEEKSASFWVVRWGLKLLNN